MFYFLSAYQALISVYIEVRLSLKRRCPRSCPTCRMEGEAMSQGQGGCSQWTEGGGNNGGGRGWRGGGVAKGA